MFARPFGMMFECETSLKNLRASFDITFANMFERGCIIREIEKSVR